VDTTCYEYKFIDSKVQKIYDSCRKIFEKHLPTQIQIRQLADISNFVESKETYKEIRLLQFEYLREVFNQIKTKEIDLEYFEEKYDYNISELIEKFSKDTNINVDTILVKN
jgi:hypothetical protein